MPKNQLQSTKHQNVEKLIAPKPSTSNYYYVQEILEVSKKTIK